MHTYARHLRLFIAAACALPLAALAHTGVDGGMHHGFGAGFVHPLGGFDHLAAMLAVGLWSALTARSTGELLWAPFSFASMLLVGAVLGLAGVSLPAVEPMIAVSLLALGLLVAMRWHLGRWTTFALVGSFAIFHGLAHGSELAGASDAGWTLAGMLAATILLHAAGIGMGLLLRRSPQWLPRATGAGMGLLGVAMLGGLV